MLIILNSSSLVLFLSAIVDYLIADPKDWIHPVQVMGWIISRGSNLCLNLWQAKWQRLLGGIILGGGLIIASGIFSWLLLRTAGNIHPVLQVLVATILLASCFAARSLRLAARDVMGAVTDNNLDLARSRLSQYVGRDTEGLSQEEILRAILETVAENTTDGVTAPLFYALIGTYFLGVEGVCLAIAYKAASTLDSMIGYRTEPYTDIGYFSAKLEDYLTWLPCRLTVLTLALFSGKPKKVLALCWRDGRQDPSPNSGWSEAVYAAILDVQLGGQNFYKGVAKFKPLLGEPIEPITAHKVEQALSLTRTCVLLWLTLGIIFDLRLGAPLLPPDLNPLNWRL